MRICNGDCQQLTHNQINYDIKDRKLSNFPLSHDAKGKDYHKIYDKALHHQIYIFLH